MRQELTWIIDAADRLSVPYSILDDGETRTLISEIESRFLFPCEGKPIWERIRNPVSRKSENAWSMACDYVGNHPCHLLVEGASDARAIRMVGIPDLKTVLGECPAFEFSLCGLESEYLLAANHHDYLIAAGSAAAWLRSY